MNETMQPSATAEVQNKPPGAPEENLLRDMLTQNELGSFFGVSKTVLDRVWAALTAPAGDSTLYVSMEIGADPDVFHPLKEFLKQRGIVNHPDPDVDAQIRKVLTGPEKIPNYSGGLGILAGDTLKSFAALKIPVVAVSLLYRKGYFSQLVDSSLGQIDWAREWHPELTPGLYLLAHPQKPGRPLRIEIPFFDASDRTVLAGAQLWLKMEVNEDLDYFVPQILLDYSISASPGWVRDAANHLYDSSSEKMKAIQRRMLGAGIIPTMDILGLTANTIHLNEQHGVVVILQLIAEYLLQQIGTDFWTRATDADILHAAEAVASRVVYTIHTPVAAGHDRFSKLLYSNVSHSFCQRVLDILAKDKHDPRAYNFTALAMRVNRATNSVSRMHREVTVKQFAEFKDKITAITNGVHHLTWISAAKAEVFDRFAQFDDWRHDPGVFANAAALRHDDHFRAALEEAWRRDTIKLIDYVNEMLDLHRRQTQETWIDPPNYLSTLSNRGGSLDPAVFTVGFARRFSMYKRPALIFEDIDTLANIIADNNWPVNFLFAGKAHPADEPGKFVLKQVLAVQEELYNKSRGLAKLIFIPGYDMAIAKLLVTGVHAWLNNPKRPLEASGTSGMKAALNAIPNISVLDGWWVEGYHDGQTGWKFGMEHPVEEEHLREDPDALYYTEDAASFYRIFPEILETFYSPHQRSRYLEKCIDNLVLNGPIFNTHRMVAEYTARYGMRLEPEIAARVEHFRQLYPEDVQGG